MFSRLLKSSIKILSVALLVIITGCYGQSDTVQYRNTQTPSYYQPNPYYYQPQQQVPQQNYQQGGNYRYQQQAPASRYYTNPYAFPPRNQYPYYDTDQQYVPPSSYGNNGDNSDGGFEKF